MVKAKYVSSDGKTINLSCRPYILTEDNELHNYNWETEDNGIAITGIKRGLGIVNKGFTVLIYATSFSAASTEKNELCKVFENDVVKEKFGKLFIGKYYLNCFIVSSEKSAWSDNKMRMTVKFTLVTDNPIWLNEETTAFKKEMYSSGDAGEIDYPYNYPYNYTAIESPVLINKSISDSGFIIRIYGPTVNPSLIIAGNEYSILTEVLASEQLIITSNNKEKTVFLSSSGVLTNVFALRDRSLNNFKLIPSGENQVSWNHSFNFDVTLLNERAEPEWN